MRVVSRCLIKRAVVALIQLLVWGGLQAGSGETAWILPVAMERHEAEGVRYFTRIRALNAGVQTETLSFEAFGPDGRFVRNLAPLGSDTGGPTEVEGGRWITVSLASQVESGFDGWVKATAAPSAQVKIFAEILTLRPGNGPGYEPDSVLGIVKIPLRPASTHSLAPVQMLLRYPEYVRLPAFALVNPNDRDASIQVVYSEAHRDVPPHSRTLTLGPGQRTTFLLPDLIPEILPEINILPPRFVLELGQVRVESDLPIAVASVDVLVPDGKIVGGTVVALD